MDTVDTIDFFANENETLQFDNLTIENRLDRITFSGDLDITKDKEGRMKAIKLLNTLSGIVNTLEHLNDSGELPDKIELVKPESVNNPFAKDKEWWDRG